MMKQMKNQAVDFQQIELQKKLARVHLASNRIEDAVSLYAEIYHALPEDLEVLIIFGDLYLAAQDFATAIVVYEQCLRLAPGDLDISNRMRLAQLEEAVEPAEPNPFSDEALSRMTRRLEETRTGIRAADLEKAAQLIDTVLYAENPGEAAARHLDEIDHYLPAILELNIRQSRVDRRPDVEMALRQILNTLEQNSPPQADSAPDQPVRAKPLKRFTGRVLVLSADPQPHSPRESFICRSLTQQHCTVEQSPHFPGDSGEKPDVVLACNPHLHPELLESLAACTASQIPLIVDLDHDFEQMPCNLPDYPEVGLGSPVNARVYTAALLLANVVTVPSQEMAVSLHRLVQHVAVVPEGWTMDNSLWTKPSPRRNTINIGWIGNPGQFEDVLEIRRILIRVVREFIQTQLIIAGDPQVYQIFDSLPENRRLYLPPTSPEDFPYLLGQMDILVNPLRSIPYNLTLPDTLMMQAGIKRIPWVASPIPSLIYWKEGGVIANTNEEWHTVLRQMVMETDFRRSLGEAGYTKAQEREIKKLSSAWVDVMEQTINLCSGEQISFQDSNRSHSGNPS